ncbi:MAG: hypothetical protein OXG95_00015 [Chloroflexi bacterium]|nr:hypothetical protein [Chloroflexota bacterium]
MRSATWYRLAIAFLVLAAAALAIACASDQESARPPGFYAEVAVEVESRPGDPLARFGGDSQRSVIRWWYAPDPARWRSEVETVGTIIDDGVLLTVVSGEDAWEYDDRTGAYRRVFGRYASLGAEAMLLPTFGALVGPARARTVDGLIAQWRERGDEPEVALAGEATVLDRQTRIIEVRDPSGSVARAFVDPERMFIMRFAVEAADDGQSYQAEVTALDYGTEIDPAWFTFEPPRGAHEADPEAAGSCSGASGPLSGASFPAEPGFLQPAYAPAGYHAVGTGSESGAGGCDPVAVWALLEAEGGAQILLRQRLRRGGMPRLDTSWQPAVAALDEAYRRLEGGILGLLWRNGDVVALLLADAVSIEELVRIAESANLVPERSH